MCRGGEREKKVKENEIEKEKEIDTEYVREEQERNERYKVR